MPEQSSRYLAVYGPFVSGSQRNASKDGELWASNLCKHYVFPSNSKTKANMVKQIALHDKQTDGGQSAPSK